MGLLGLTKEQLAQAIARLFGMLCEGKTDQEAADALGLDAADFQQLKGALYLQEGERLTGRSREQIYLDYIMEQRSCLRQLNVILKEFESKELKTKQLTALVGAVRAQSEIYKEVLRAGQELGIIIKTPERKELIGGIVFADMSPEQLKKAIIRELSGLEGMVKRFGEESILEIEAGKMHRALPPPMKPKGSPTQKAKRTKRYAGRPVAPKQKAKKL